MTPSTEHPFSWRALGRIITAGIIVLLAWKAQGILIVVLISLMLAVALYPIAKKINKKLPMIISVVMVIIILLIPLVALITIISLTFEDQFPAVLTVLTPVLGSFHLTPDIIQHINLAGYVEGHFTAFLDSTKQITLAIATLLTTIFLTFYFMYDAKRLFVLFLDLFPIKHKETTTNFLKEISLVTGQYIRGNLLISLICIVIIYAGLALLHIPFALPIAIFTGIMDLLPVIGPILGSIPALVLGFAMSPLTGILVLVLYLGYKQVEDVAIGPAIYNKTLNLLPALVFISVVIGAGMFGVIGAFLALPVAASIPVIVRYREQFLS